MGVKEEAAQVLAAKLAVVFPHLDEGQRRLLMAAEARALGHGGIRLVARAAGVREATVSLGVDELEAGTEPLRRAAGSAAGRRAVPREGPGGGAKAGRRGGSGAAPCAGGPGRAGGARQSDVGTAVDHQV